MQQYHFDLIDTFDAIDINGSILVDDEAAKKVAHELAHEVRAARPELIGKGYEVRVRKENGEEISRVAIDDVAKDGNGL